MKHLLYALLLLFPGMLKAQQPAEKYAVDSATLKHTNVPAGEILHYTFKSPKIFPGTEREYWVYIPAAYEPSKPASVFVDQDGIQFNAPVVFDNLIHSGEMPVTIGIFIQPGRVKGSDKALDRFNRSLEYDGISDAYVRFLLEELLPDVETHKATNGRAIVLSKKAGDRAIGGSSSGAIAAFTAAWQRPDAFSKVFSSIGTYVAFRGGDTYPAMIRKYEPKPIRVFLQDGSNDQNSNVGNWFLANNQMESALTFAGYQVAHVWGEGAHNGIHATAIFPQAMRWLWNSGAGSMKTGNTKNTFLHDLLIPGEGWELVGSGYGFTEGTGADSLGNIYYQDIPNSATYRVGLDKKLVKLPLDSKKASGTAFGPDGRRYVAAGGTRQVLSYSADGKERVVADSINGNDLIIGHNGNIYVTAPEGSEKPSKIFLIKPDGSKRIVDLGLKFANGIAFTPDQTQLYITESATHWVWIYTIAPDGSLTNKQRYGWLHSPDNEDNAWPDGLRCDREGHIYIASRVGIQVMDQLGKVNAILPLPITHGQASNLYFGGPDLNIMYVTCNDKVFRRKLNVKGVNAFQEPIKPVTPRL